MTLIEVKHAIKTYQSGEDSFNALDDVSLKVKKGAPVPPFDLSNCLPSI